MASVLELHEPWTNGLRLGFYRRSGRILFKAIVHRKEADSIVLPTVSEKTSRKTSGKMLEAILQKNTITIPELSTLIGITERSIERNLQKLQKEKRYTETYWPSQIRALAGFLTYLQEVLLGVTNKVNIFAG